MVKVLSENGAADYSSERHHAAVAKTARANGTPSGDAENFAKNVMNKIESWIRDKEEITAEELRAVTAGAMAQYDEDAAYLYGSENRMF
jgi:predicted alpha/beta superfamily hydrolase